MVVPKRFWFQNFSRWPIVDRLVPTERFYDLQSKPHRQKCMRIESLLLIFYLSDNVLFSCCPKADDKSIPIDIAFARSSEFTTNVTSGLLDWLSRSSRIASPILLAEAWFIDQHITSHCWLDKLIAIYEWAYKNCCWDYKIYPKCRLRSIFRLVVLSLLWVYESTTILNYKI